MQLLCIKIKKDSRQHEDNRVMHTFLLLRDFFDPHMSGTECLWKLVPI